MVALLGGRWVRIGARVLAARAAAVPHMRAAACLVAARMRYVARNAGEHDGLLPVARRLRVLAGRRVTFGAALSRPPDRPGRPPRSQFSWSGSLVAVVI